MNYLIIKPLTTLWFCGIAFSISFILSILLIVRLLSLPAKKQLAEWLGAFLFFDIFFYAFYEVHIGCWNIRYSLPLTFCAIMEIFASIALITRWLWFYEISFFLGIIIPLQAILAPGVRLTGDWFLVVEFFICHSSIILAPLYLFYHLKMFPRPFSWFKSFVQCFPILFFVMLVNKVLHANYMFLQQKPCVTHPLNTGAWPFYLIIWSTGAILTNMVLYFLVKIFRKRRI